MKLLSRSEEIILLTVLKLKDEAYGVSIREQIYNNTGHKWSFASIYQPLDKLVRKNYVRKIAGEPTPERGGKRKYYYRITPQGKKALKIILDTHEKVWNDVSQMALE